MGVINHNAIIATTWCDDEASAIFKWCQSLKPEHERLFMVNMNPYGDHTIVMTPDGSKEGWEYSNDCDKLREEFIELLESRAYEDGSNAWKYVEVSFGEQGQSIVTGNNKCVLS